MGRHGGYIYGPPIIVLTHGLFTSRYQGPSTSSVPSCCTPGESTESIFFFCFPLCLLPLPCLQLITDKKMSGFAGASITKAWITSLGSMSLLSTVLPIKSLTRLRISPHITRKLQASVYLLYCASMRLPDLLPLSPWSKLTRCRPHAASVTDLEAVYVNHLLPLAHGVTLGHAAYLPHESRRAAIWVAQVCCKYEPPPALSPHPFNLCLGYIESPTASDFSGLSIVGVPICSRMGIKGPRSGPGSASKGAKAELNCVWAVSVAIPGNKLLASPLFLTCTTGLTRETPGLY